MIDITPYRMSYEWRLERKEEESKEGQAKAFLQEYGRMTSNLAYEKICGWIRAGLIAQQEFFMNPEKYFWVDRHYLRLLGTNLSFRLGIVYRGPGDVLYPQALTEEEMKAIDRCYGANHPSANPNKTLRAIYDYLSSIETTPYYKALMEFKWRTGLLSFPLFDIKEKIKKIDGKLVECVWDNKRSVWIPYRLLTSEVVEEEVRAERDRIRQEGECEPVKDELKRRLGEELLASHKEETLDKKNFQASFLWGSVNYSLPISGQLNVYHDTSKEPYVRSKPHPKPELSLNGRNSLRELTGGDSKLLDDIAELVARLFMPEKPSSYLWIICAKEKRPLLQFDQNTVSQFINWILCLTEFRYGTAADESNQEKRNKQLAEEQVLGRLFQINPTPKKSADFKKMNQSWLKRFIQGEETGTLNDPYQKEQSITGKSVLLYATTDFNEADFKNIPHKVIRVPKDWTFSDWTIDDIKWVQTCLLCHGLHIVLGQNAEHKTETITKDDVIRKFVREFCEDSPDSWIERKTLCKWLTEYTKAYFPTAGIKNESTKLGADVDKLLVWKPETIRKNNNRLGYKGKHLNEEKLGEVLRQASESRDEEKTAVDFDQYIASFSDLIKIQEQNP